MNRQFINTWIKEMTVYNVLARYTGRTGTPYEIRKGVDLVVYCNCKGWQMRKVCKHMLDYTVNGGRTAAEIITQPDRTIITSKKQLENLTIEDATEHAIKLLKNAS